MDQIHHETAVDIPIAAYWAEKKHSILGTTSCILVIWVLIGYIRNALRPGLRSLPGPRLAHFSKLYRAWKILEGDAPEFYTKLHDQYGPVVRTGPNTVSISDPESVPIIYGINSKYLKSAFYDTLSPSYEGTVMQSMFTIRNPVLHQALRRPVSQKFSMTSIKALEPFADDCTQIFIEAIYGLEGQAVDLGKWLQWYAFDVIGGITFQRRFGFLEERRDIEGMINGIDTALKYAGVVGQIPEWHPWLMGNVWVGKFLEAQPFVKVPDPFRTVVRFTQECVDEYDKNPSAHSTRPDFLGWLRSEEQKGKPMSNRDMINHLSNNLFAGSDTTAISLRSIFYFVIKNPNVYRKLQREIDEADQNGKLSKYVTYSECLELKYLQAVMKESMRCHPGVSFPLERVVPDGGSRLCGTDFAAGTIVGVNPAVLHRDKTIFGEDAASFRPERWTDSDPEQIRVMDRNIMTFGYGSRTCIGKNISIMEMGKFVPQILRYFDIEWASDKPDWNVETYWFAKQHGLICRFKSRAKCKPVSS